MRRRVQPQAPIGDGDLIRRGAEMLGLLSTGRDTLWSCESPDRSAGPFIEFRFHRAEAGPVISWDYTHDFKDPRETDWKLLAEAPPRIIAAALEPLAGLLERTLAEYESRQAITSAARDDTRQPIADVRAAARR